jgi:CRISPR-associated protein Csd2
MQNRYDFVFLFDVKDGNPNGDPDAGNLPRTDAETGQGLVTDVCIKRKIRNFVGLVRGENPPFEIYVKERAVLNLQHERAYAALNLKSDKRTTKGKEKEDEDRSLTKWMCGNFFDIRTFGAVMTTKVNCGQVRGPVQFGMARSIDPIVAAEHAVTRCAVATEKEAEKQEGDNRTMGRKFTVPYALYRIHGYINPHLAAQTGFNENQEDLDLFWTALMQMFENDRSASRGEMSPQALIIFKHETALGNAPANKLFARVTVQKRATDNGPPRSFTDYTVTIDEENLPAGVSIDRKL